MSDVTAAILFLFVVGLIVVVGIVVGIIVAGRMDRLMTPRPATPADAGDQPADEPADAAGAEEEEQP